MIEKKTWQDFADSGMLFAANTILHFFGWAIVVETEADGTVSLAYPARTIFRGFSAETSAEGFRKLHAYMAANAAKLEAERT